MSQYQFTNQELVDMTMDLLLKRLTEESPHLSSPTHGHGKLEIVYNYKSVPKLIDSYSIIKENGAEVSISFPTKQYDEVHLKNNVRILYNIVQKYISIREIPQGRLAVVFEKGKIVDCYVNNEGTYNDIKRTGKPKVELDDILFDDEEEEDL